MMCAQFCMFTCTTEITKFCILLQKYCIPSLYVCCQIFCILLQKYCVSPGNFVFARSRPGTALTREQLSAWMTDSWAGSCSLMVETSVVFRTLYSLYRGLTALITLPLTTRYATHLNMIASQYPSAHLTHFLLVSQWTIGSGLWGRRRSPL